VIENDIDNEHQAGWIKRLFNEMKERGLTLVRDKMTEEWVQANGKEHRVVTVENPESLGSVIRRAMEGDS
jgi:hypothetical protein